MPNVWPNNLISLHLGSIYNKPLKDLPPTLNILIFDKYGKFSHSIDELPQNIEILYLRKHFNMSIANLLSQLIKLKLS